MEHPTKYYSSIQEKAVADALGWKTVSASGSRPGHPGDVISDEWLVECKTHVKQQNKITFKLDVWDKLVIEATSVFKYPVLIVDDGSQKLSNTWCLINLRQTPFTCLSYYTSEAAFIKNISFKHSAMYDNYIMARSSRLDDLRQLGIRLVVATTPMYPNFAFCPFEFFKDQIVGD